MRKRALIVLTFCVAAVTCTLFYLSSLWSDSVGPKEFTSAEAKSKIAKLFSGTKFEISDPKAILFYGMQYSGSQVRFNTSEEAVVWLAAHLGLKAVEASNVPREFLENTSDDPPWWRINEEPGRIFVGDRGILKFISGTGVCYIKMPRVLD